jgi:hypothetical protein
MSAYAEQQENVENQDELNIGAEKEKWISVGKKQRNTTKIEQKLKTRTTTKMNFFVFAPFFFSLFRLA